MSSSGSAMRRCSRQTCTRDAVMTLTYVYSDSTAVVGPLAAHAEPHAYDLCGVHADRLTVPRGWRVVRLELPEAAARRDDIDAVAEAVREPEPVPGVRDRPRTVLRDVSLPRPGAAPGSAPAVDAAPGARPAPAVPEEPAAAAPRRAPAEVPWHDAPMPQALQRPHLRRPATGSTGPLPPR
ncbi:DUF3499 domain-containing protein [Kocuria rosea]|uniref:DUF3499 domain-containing protein n=1 Tax=Kocuria rosea TaxID=1275 RepID=UPI0027E2B8C1|nr:DUF3499 domain-containing protein [Kocuria rosea]